MAPKKVMTCGFEMIMGHERPHFAIIVGSWDHTFSVLEECIIAVRAAEIVVEIGSCSGIDIDKFEAHGLRQVCDKKLIAPLTRECKANNECRVADTRMLSKYNMPVREAVQVWLNPELNNGNTIHH